MCTGSIESSIDGSFGYMPLTTNFIIVTNQCRLNKLTPKRALSHDITNRASGVAEVT